MPGREVVARAKEIEAKAVEVYGTLDAAIAALDRQLEAAKAAAKTAYPILNGLAFEALKLALANMEKRRAEVALGF